MGLFGGGGGPGPAEKQAAKQGAQMFGTGFPVIEMVSNLIRDALSGNVGKFESMPLAQGRASSTRKAGAKRGEATRRGLAGRGLEGTSAGQAELQNIGFDTDAAVFESLMSEMTRYTDMAPGFGLQTTGQGMQTTSNAAQTEQRRGSSDPMNQILPMLIMAAGTAAGTALGGPLGAAGGMALAGLFSSMMAPAPAASPNIGGVNIP